VPTVVVDGLTDPMANDIELDPIGTQIASWSSALTTLRAPGFTTGIALNC